jgi:methyl-accepting chemotaxis protein
MVLSMNTNIRSSHQASTKNSNRAVLVVIAVLLLLGMAGAAGIYNFTEAERARVISDLVAKKAAETRNQALDAGHALTEIYQNIRTLSMLPDVRAMDRHASNLGENAKATIQQIYNNIWSNVQVSEIYFVPASFDPSRKDTVTGKGEEPALMYDEMITGKEKANTPSTADTTPAVKEQPELEGEEYVLLTKQIAYFRQKFPSISSFDGLNVPVVAGPEVMTCDNTDFNNTLKEYDRRGLVFSVPYYLPNGSLGGVVAAIVRLRIIEKYLPVADSALVNVNDGAVVNSTQPGQAAKSDVFVSKGVKDPSLISSESIKMDLPDPQGAWFFWRGVSNASVLGSPEVLAIRNQQVTGMSLVTLAALLSIALVFYVSRFYVKPAYRITETLLAIAEGKISTDIPAADRRGMLGDIGRAVIIFRNNMLALKTSEVEAAEARARSEADRKAAEERAEREAEERLRIATAGLANGLTRLAQGDLAFQLNEPFAPDFETLRHNFNASVRQLNETLSAISDATGTIDSGTREIRQGTEDLSRRTAEQTGLLSQTATTFDQITTNVGSSSQRVNDARHVAGLANESAIKSGVVVNQAVAAMSRIEDSSGQISSIIGVIDQIAFQTNLLALNAGVEAARAGDAGKGFAVVAQEVRELAQRSAKAAKEIKELIEKSKTEVEGGVKLVRDTGQALTTIGDYISEINKHMEAITASTREQSEGLADAGKAVNAMNRTTGQNAQMVQNATITSATLATEAEKLRDLVNHFSLGRADSGRGDIRATQQSPSFRRSA